MRLADVLQDPRDGKNAPYSGMPEGHIPVRSYLAAPVISRAGKVLGGLFFGHPEVGVFTEKSELLLEGLSAQAAIAIDNAYLFRERTETLNFLKKSLSQLEKSNAELARFAFVASHDLKEPLRVIGNYVQLLGRANAATFDEKSSQYMEFVTDATKRMNALINDLLSFSQNGDATDKPQLVDLNTIVKEVAANLEISIRESDADVSWGALPTVSVDLIQMVRLFQNLIGNAIKFQTPGVRPQVKITAVQDGEYWRFSVTDNGIGIAPEYHEKVFVLFQRLHAREEYDGTGLGLAICRKIVENYGGKLSVMSAPGEGATFSFTLPAGQGVL